MMSPLQAVGRVFRNTFNFAGRASRAELWWWVAFVLVGIWLSGQVDGWLGTESKIPREPRPNGQIMIGVNYGFGRAFGVVENIFNALVLLPGVAVGVRRLHDRGMSGMWLLSPVALFVMSGAMSMAGLNGIALPFALAGLASLVALMVVCALPGQDHENDYGPPPLESAG